MSIICPTVMPQTNDPHEYRDQIERLAPLSDRLQIDLMDGDFAPHKNISPIQLWWPERSQVDLHVMYRTPAEHITTLISMRPSMIIVHFESDGDIISLIKHIKEVGIKAGVALLKETSPFDAHEAIEIADHILVFGGQLGESGVADLSMLQKVDDIKSFAPSVEIGWDGGGGEFVHEISEAGVDVINVGGVLRDAQEPVLAYNALVAKLQ